MTQEELDALMSGDIDDLDLDEAAEEEVVAQEETKEEEVVDPLEALTQEEKEYDITKVKDDEVTLPLPATNENKMVHQLDDVTKESEEKATEIFDIIEGVSNDLMDAEEHLNSVKDVIESNIELFEKLTQKFPHVEAFKQQLEKNQGVLDAMQTSEEILQNSGDSIMNVMDIMQYQDIHRQKIERVINVMRSLSRYMNTLFEGKIEDEKRVSSAQHIIGDTHNDVASDDDIEALLAQFGN